MKRKNPTAARLDEFIEEATVDAFDESEQTAGCYTMLEDDRIVAVCVRGPSRQRISLLDLPLPEPPPAGSDWIHACRRRARWR